MSLDFVANNLLAVAAAFAIGRLLTLGREGWRCALATLISFGVIIQLVLLVLGTTVGLSNLRIQLAFAGLLGVVLVVGRVLPPAADGAPEQDERAPGRWARRVGFASAALLGGEMGMRIAADAIGGTRYSFDDLTYHATLPAQWLLDGRIGLIPFTYQTYYPCNTEIMSLWFMESLGSDTYASLAVLYWSALLTVALIAIGRAQGGRALGYAAAALFWASGTVFAATLSFSGQSLAGPAMVLAAAAILLPSASAASASGALIDLALAGAALGFATGSRITFATAVPVAFAYWALCIRESPLRRWLPLGLAVFALAVASTGAYSYVRNLLLTGNPVYPAEIAGFQGPFDHASQARTQLFSWLVAQPIDPSRWALTLQASLAWPLSLGLVAVAGYGVAVARGFRGHRSALGCHTIFLGALGLIQIIQFPFQPFSATYNRPHADFIPMFQYVMLAFAIGVLLFAMILDERTRTWIRIPASLLATAGLIHGLVSVQQCLGKAAADARVHLVGAALGGALAAGLAIWGWSPRVRLRHGVIASTVVVATLTLCAPVKQRWSDENLYRWSPELGGVLRVLDGVPSGSRTALFMAEPFTYTWFYPLFGRRFQLTPVPLARDGRPHDLLHRGTERDPWWGEWQRLSAPLDGEAFMANLRAARVDYVLVTRLIQGQWPRQQEVLRASQGAKLVFQDEWAVLWQVGGAAP